jgi:ferredoxin
MIRIRRDECVGCGLCVENCPFQAISLINNKAEINQQKCNQCRICLAICPKGAIAETVTASLEEIKSMINELRHKTEITISRIEQQERQN